MWPSAFLLGVIRRKRKQGTAPTLDVASIVALPCMPTTGFPSQAASSCAPDYPSPSLRCQLVGMEDPLDRFPCGITRYGPLPVGAFHRITIPDRWARMPCLG